MSRFITRVELHGASYQDYQNLHAAMELQGFSRTIAGSNGHEYQLPTAEYSLEANLTIESVRTRTKNAADSTGRDSGILVTEGESAWIGLPIAAPQQSWR